MAHGHLHFPFTVVYGCHNFARLRASEKSDVTSSHLLDSLPWTSDQVPHYADPPNVIVTKLDFYYSVAKVLIISFP